MDGTPLPVPTGRAGPRHEDALRRRGGIPTAPPHPYNPIFFNPAPFIFISLFIYYLFFFTCLILAGALCFFMLFPSDFFVCFCLHDFLLEIVFRNSLE